MSDFTDFFLICSASNERQVRAIADGVFEALQGLGEKPLHVEGQGEGQWVLIDLGDIVVHIFEHERRTFYRLESLWGDAPDFTESLG